MAVVNPKMFIDGPPFIAKPLWSFTNCAHAILRLKHTVVIINSNAVFLAKVEVSDPFIRSLISSLGNCFSCLRFHVVLFVIWMCSPPAFGSLSQDFLIVGVILPCLVSQLIYIVMVKIYCSLSAVLKVTPVILTAGNPCSFDFR